jgi:catechol 2,3-dioxygenase-like lactoylglutathione lyase family enzyme
MPAIKALGEIALRVKDLDAMQAFYENTIGLERMRRFPHAAFFRIATGHAGHTQILALFDRTAVPDPANPASLTGPEPAASSIDHLAFAIDLADYASEKSRLEALGLNVLTAEHAWTHWRSLYVHDPEKNLVELVCHDPNV